MIKSIYTVLLGAAISVTCTLYASDTSSTPHEEHKPVYNLTSEEGIVIKSGGFRLPFFIMGVKNVEEIHGASPRSLKCLSVEGKETKRDYSKEGIFKIKYASFQESPLNSLWMDIIHEHKPTQCDLIGHTDESEINKNS